MTQDGNRQSGQPTNHHKEAQQPAKRSVKLRTASRQDNGGRQQKRKRRCDHVSRKEKGRAARQLEHLIGQRDHSGTGAERDEPDRHNEEDRDDKNCHTRQHPAQFSVASVARSSVRAPSRSLAASFKRAS